MSEIINELISIKDNYCERIEEEIFSNMNYEEKYRDLTTAEIKEINKYRKNIFYIYEAIHILDKVKESE